MFAYVARQPIFNRRQQTIGHELLFRDGECNAFPAIDANEATCRLVLENYMAIGDDLAYKGQRNFINFPHSCLVNLIPLLLPKNKVVIEILETCTPDDELFLAIKHLHHKGYIIALDDFEYDVRWHRFFRFVHIIKLDLLMLGLNNACDFVRNNRHMKVKFLAEKVETYDDFQVSLAAGFDLFQGYYFSRPELLKRRKVAPSELTTIQLLQAVSAEPVNFTDIETIISSDVSLSYLLLRYVNQTNQRLVEPISSFHQALVYLGEEKLRMFVGVVATAHAALDKPKALYALSLQRAKMCEILVDYSPLEILSQQAFLAGMFSLLDALLDSSLAELLGLLKLQPNIQAALLHRQGELGQVLNLVDAFDKADWRQVARECCRLGLSEQQVQDSYLRAVTWADKCAQIDNLS
ncbi:HDOD domain-containing protein [Photobacterium phosphoreum]|jgi:EAL and modified HD-GYP domain-containing signal transduction protein|uniref:HDOD domain-containing protein n=1 Tax=Photobacterium phosphoreum TaxID=659 RepID=A0AAW4ZRT3_PHOPO|nr:HDOD domain-containing protein [Photobacterium phosphoreum]KJF85252.1 histidine kinase [Photobacterium phosphoreum]MCD9471356.1 histidine kinase [Photobacterium phosphoreum]MCD9476692.1 HDOD domain-containing protein [Photobacterium phosphoreum]MCD9479666.1 HDOD domain-containing protein [Photobacterium phosphoreum]MCD9483941.1 HDOD domain-containing protein [Photobacterium phosphoreum]